MTIWVLSNYFVRINLYFGAKNVSKKSIDFERPTCKGHIWAL